MRRHLALHRGSLRSAPWRSSSVARPPSMTANPPALRSKSVINDDVSSALPGPMAIQDGTDGEGLVLCWAGYTIRD